MKEISEEKEGVISSLNFKSANELGNRVHGGGGGGGATPETVFLNVY